MARLITMVDVRDAGADPLTVSFSARLAAALEDGRRITLLDDRGWTESLRRAPAGAPPDVSDIWSTMSVADIEETARMVVGPDEPVDGRSHEDEEALHLAFLSEILGRHGIAVEPLELSRLSHDVIISERLLARLGH